MGGGHPSIPAINFRARQLVQYMEQDLKIRSENIDRRELLSKDATLIQDEAAVEMYMLKIRTWIKEKDAEIEASQPHSDPISESTTAAKKAPSAAKGNTKAERQ